MPITGAVDAATLKVAVRALAVDTAICRAAKLPLLQTVVPISNERRQQIRQNGARARCDFDGYRHSWRQVDHLIVDHHFRTVERDTSREDQLLSRRLARRIG